MDCWTTEFSCLVLTLCTVKTTQHRRDQVTTLRREAHSQEEEDGELTSQPQQPHEPSIVSTPHLYTGALFPLCTLHILICKKGVSLHGHVKLDGRQKFEKKKEKEIKRKIYLRILQLEDFEVRLELDLHTPHPKKIPRYQMPAAAPSHIRETGCKTHQVHPVLNFWGFYMPRAWLISKEWIMISMYNKLCLESLSLSLLK